VPYARSANDIPAALREDRQPAPARWIQQRAMISFIAERTGEEPSGALVDQLMRGELGAKRASYIDLDGLLRRTVRRLLGHSEPAPVTYEVPDLS
jgi:hypothetical protein